MNTIILEGLTLELQTAAHADEMFAVLNDPAIYARPTRPRRAKC